MSKIQNFFLTKLALPQIDRLEMRENKLAEDSNNIKFNEHSPIRFNIPKSAMKRRMETGKGEFSRSSIPLMFGSMRGIHKSLKSLKKNPRNPRTKISKEELIDLVEFAKKQGVTSVGFTKIEPVYIFKPKAVLHENTIVLTMEMDKDLIAMAPSDPTQTEIHLIYNLLGKATNSLADWLRERGFSAHGIPPLNGATLFPPLAEKSGLGYHGLHGLIITPEHGPRVRLSAVYTSIENLPFNMKNNHEWITEYCAKCQLCIKKCPPQAIHLKPIFKEGGIITHVDQDTCFPEFNDNFGCTICIAVCPFSKQDYDILKKVAKNKNN